MARTVDPCRLISRGDEDALLDEDLTGLFWTKQCENMSLERSFGYAEEEVSFGSGVT
jgi:hypothetical protein